MLIGQTTDQKKQDVERASQLLQEQEIQSVRVEWCDIHGASRGKQMSAGHFLSAIESGTTFSSAALQMDLQGEAYHMPGQPPSHSWVSLIAQPDVSTLQPFVADPGVARCLADLRTVEGSPVGMSPRHALRRVVDEGHRMGLHASVGLELEFYLLPGETDRRQPPARHVYRMQSSEEEHRFLAPLYGQMAAAGIGLEALCAEDGPGQFELILQRGDPITVADAAFTARNLVKELASRQGLIATFLSRPLPDHSGSGAHIHQSLWTASGEPLFTSGSGEGDAPFWQFLSGQLRHFQEAAALYLPTINAYKRLALRQPEPLRVDWAYEDRSAALRVLGSSSRSLRIENRAVAGEANPYLSLAAALATGFEGIRNRETLPGFSQRTHDNTSSNPSTGGPLPRTLGDALAALSASTIIRLWLGSEIIDAFLYLKGMEVRRYETAITDWELREYLTSL
ncbi:MAG: glutamine synthetase family protein [Armatimonadota bacterium]|nr:glutamine synthetase family protein [Armatimonadota bacterium]